MREVLTSLDEELRDLAAGAPPLVDAATGTPLGVRLSRWLGAGGMSAVFLAEREPSAKSELLSDLAPQRMAVKIVKPYTEQRLAQLNLSSVDITRREVAALARVRSLRPPTEFIVSLYGSGSLLIRPGDEAPLELPWIALELVEDVGVGATLRERVELARDDGIDPVRALRLVRGLIEGVSVFHRVGIVHRDIKPENVFVAGPVDDETPKLADCGIARVEGLLGPTIHAATPQYAAPEQLLSAFDPQASNPLIGPWTDVHALSATIFYLLAGEPWCRTFAEWDTGRRRSLRTARKLHRGLMDDDGNLDALDRALGRAAAHKLPAEAWARKDTTPYREPARHRFAASMFRDGPARHATITELAAELMPPLEAAAARWTERAAREQQPVTQFRTARLRSAAPASARVVREILPPPRGGPTAALGPGDVAFLRGQWAFARTGERVFCFAQAEPSFFEIPVPPAHRAEVAGSRWLVRGPGSGIALVGPAHILLLPRSDFLAAPLPRRPEGGEVGPIQAVLGDGRTFGVVTAETEDSNGGPELWTSTNGATWAAPVILPLGGEAHAIASGPLGIYVVGSRRGKKARALSLGYDQRVHVFTYVNDRAPLVTAVAGPEGEAWAAGEGVVLRFEPGGVTEEPAPSGGVPVAMGLDLDGVPWLLFERTVLRRKGGGEPTWQSLYERGPDAPPLCAIGFTPGGARVVDVLGGGALIEPEDSASTVAVVT